MSFNSQLAEELINRKVESPELDYKVDFDNSTGAWFEIAKDVYGMANFGGGFIVVGVRDGTFQPIGVSSSFHIDSQAWVERISKWATGAINIAYLEHTRLVNGQERKFPILRIHGSIGSFVIPKVDGKYRLGDKEITAFRLGIIYTRQNTSTVPAGSEQFPQLFLSMIKRSAEEVGGQAVPVEAISLLKKRAHPEAVEETLWTNLFPVVELPDFINVAETEFRQAQEIYEWIEEELGEERKNVEVPSFFLSEGKIYSFLPFDRKNPLTPSISSPLAPVATKEWIADPKRQRGLVMLLNYNLKALCWKKGFAYDPIHDRFFKRYRIGKTIDQVRWKPYKAFSTRPLIYVRRDGKGNVLYCEHFAGRLKFTILGEGIYLVVEPLRVITEDGERPLDWKRTVRIRTKSNFHYHNNNYLYDSKLWMHLLAGNKNEIHLGHGDGKIVVSVLSTSAKVNVGILDDQHTGGDFLDSLKSEPLEYVVETDEAETSPLTETPLEEE